jgi:signal transduction histidine kinase/BarA-like signal transduction histidine kinase
MSEPNRRKFAERRIKAIYLTSLISFITTFFTSVVVFFYGNTTLSYFIFFSAVVFLTTTIMSKNEMAQKARIIFLWMFNIFITALASLLGKEASLDFFFIFSIGLPYSFFSFSREKKKIFFYSAITFVFWFYLYITKFAPFIEININNSGNISKIIYHVSITTTLLLVVIQLIYFSYTNAKTNTNAHQNKQDAINDSDAKSYFLSTMSHEIRTPLNAVIGLSHILGDNKPRKDQVQNIEALNYSGKILLNLLNNVLDFSKMQSTKIDLDEIPTDLLSAVKQIKKVHEASCIQKGIRMNLEIDKDIPIIWLDIVRFNQIINNLVSNAIKFTKKGSVTLKIKKVKLVQNEVTLLTEIIDTGIGIPKDKQERIWEAFTQASSATNRLYGGTGLGLPIVKNIIKAMNSDIYIDSKPDKGSRFHFNIKVKVASAKDLENTKQKKEYNFLGKKVLLVEDNQINVMVSQQILEKVNLKVIVAYNGLEAVNMMKQEHFDIVLMDIQMPIMDGYEASKEIRTFNKYIPILALSASVFMEVKNRIKECGMNGFIFKPFEPEDLLDKIASFIYD